MGIGALAAISAIPALTGLVSGIGALRANRQLKENWQNRATLGDEYLRPYEQNVELMQRLYRGGRPGAAQEMSEISQAGARARGDAARGAISSGAYQSTVGDVYQKELDAIQDFARRNREWAAGQAQNLNLARSNLGEQKLQQWNVNEWLPWQMQRQEIAERRKANIEGLYGAIQGLGDNLTDFLGTKYLSDTIGGLYPQALPAGNRSTPMTSNYSPQENLLNTLSGLFNTSRTNKGGWLNFPESKYYNG